MEKKLPKVFANKPDKVFNNNEKVYYSKELKETEKERNEQAKPIEKNIYQKINEIFTSEKYVYKADVEVKTKTGQIRTRIIGQNRTHLITMDNNLIPISDIEDIRFSD